LGDLYSVVWMENSDAEGEWEPIKVQTQITTQETTLSHVMEYGSKDFVAYPIGDFQGNLNYTPSYHLTFQPKGVAINAARQSPVDSRDINLHVKYNNYIRAVQRKAPAEKVQQALSELQAELARREFADTFFNAFSFSVKSDGSLHSSEVRLPVSGTACQKAVDKAIAECGAWNDYSLKYHKIVVNACMQPGEKLTTSLVSTVNSICSQMNKPVGL